MIHHLCGKPTVDDGKPMTFIFDEACAECNKIRNTPRMRKKTSKEIADERFQHYLKRRFGG